MFTEKRQVIRLCMFVFVITVLMVCPCSARKKLMKNTKQLPIVADEESRETSPPNFVRLVLMRLVYGLAVQMGLEERIAGVFNGAFVPPNAEEDEYGGSFLEDVGAGDLGDDLLDF